MVSPASTVYAFFDFDDTLVAGDSILYWMRFYYARRPKRRVFQIANGIGLGLFLLRLIDSHALKRIFLWPMAWENKGELDRLAQAFVLEDLAHRFHRPVLERLWSHHLLGHKVVVISASASFYLQHLRALLPPVEILGTDMEWPETKWALPRYREANLRGQRKVEVLRNLGYEKASALGFAYSDHHHDMPLLAFVEFPTCIFPTSRLRRRAKSLGWPLWLWEGRPPLWKRRLHKLGLLLFAVEWFSEVSPGPRSPLPGQPQSDHQGFLASHSASLQSRVLEKHFGDEGERALALVLGKSYYNHSSD